MLAASGAAPLLLIAVVVCRSADETRTKASPPNWPLHGSTTIKTAPAAAASTALPPARRSRRPAALASGLTLAIMP